MPNVEWLLLALSPLFGLSVVVEYYFAKRLYQWRDSFMNALLALSHQLVDALSLLLLMPCFYWLSNFALFTIELTTWTLFLGFILQDFLYYWFHRASHHIHWFWTAHSVHHSSTLMNFTTAFRQSVLYPITGMWLFWLPMIVIGFEPKLVLTIVAINLAFQFFVHTQLVTSLGWLEKVLNTPTHHRLHHASNDCYIDKNFAGVLIIWDKLFGTFVEPQQGVSIQYGIRGALPTSSFWAINFAQFLFMVSLFKRAPTITQKIRVLFAYPIDLPPIQKPVEFSEFKPHSKGTNQYGDNSNDH
ncbi:hypothetical protein PALB_35050 [Pseudoalteromonas luteoviolacea B = ATCC 29581]|nr:hypothetical protein PALB_35050 [Pseudoalteromonas luteoviolacea B = ATCC 29581]